MTRRCLLLLCGLLAGPLTLRAVETIRVLARPQPALRLPPPSVAPESGNLAETAVDRPSATALAENTPLTLLAQGTGSILDRRKGTPVPDDRAPVIIEKRGGRDEEEPEDREAPRVLWFFGGDKYLTRSVRQQIDAPSVRRGRWRYIVIHNSGTRQGNARVFDHYHRRVRRMPNGMAYQFVIGNGNGSGNGRIEIGGRWSNQLPGGHCASDYINNIAIGICLVGDFNRDNPTKAQLASLEELINYLRRRVGRVDRQLAQVKGHREINPRPTDCPGRRFPLRWMHRKFD